MYILPDRITEHWGSGALNTVDWCAQHGNTPPTWAEQAGSVYVTFSPAVLPGRPQTTAEVAAQMLSFCRVPRRAAEIMDLLGLKYWKSFQLNYLHPILDAGLIEQTIPDKPTSSKQRYPLGSKGKVLLESIETGQS